MTESRNCGQCGSHNEPGARQCAACGADLPEDVLSHVDGTRRVELTRFDTSLGEEAELACGLLRANGIPCELSSTALPGLPSDLILWVSAGDVRAARALMEDAQRDAHLGSDAA